MPRPFMVGLSLLLLPASALGQSCLDTVQRLSSQYGLESQPPAAEQQASSLTEKLKDSGGVIKPPEVGAPAAIRPPHTDEGMKTAPPVTPQPSEGTKPAARVAQMEALLTAAREAGERGNEGECLARLAEAEQLAAAADSPVDRGSR